MSIKKQTESASRENPFEGMKCVCGKILVIDEWLCPDCKKKRDVPYEQRTKFCELCGRTEELHPHIGGPVQLVCKNCVNIIRRYKCADHDQHDLWRQINGVDEPIEDEYDIGKRVTEIEIICAEFKRVLYNMRDVIDVKIPQFPIILDNGDREESFIRTFFLEHPIHTFVPQSLSEAAHNLSMKNATDVCNKLVNDGYLECNDRGYRLSKKEIEKLRGKLEREIANEEKYFKDSNNIGIKLI